MDAIATLEGLNFLQSQQAAATLGGRRNSALSGCLGCGVSGFDAAPGFTMTAAPEATVEAARLTICQANTKAEVAKREAVTLDAQAKAAAKKGDTGGATLLAQEAAKKAAESVAATEQAAKATLVARAVKREAELTKEAQVAAAKGDAGKATVFIAAAQKAQQQAVQAATAKNTTALACKCAPGMSGLGRSGGGLAGLFGFGANWGKTIGKTAKACAGQDIKACIEAKQAQITETAKAADAANAEALPVKASFLGDLPQVAIPFVVLGGLAWLLMRK